MSTVDAVAVRTDPWLYFTRTLIAMFPPALLAGFALEQFVFVANDDDDRILP